MDKFTLRVVLLIVAVLVTASSSLAQTNETSIDEINFATPKDKEKFARLPESVKDIIFNKKPSPPPSKEAIAFIKDHSLRSIGTDLRVEKGSKEWDFHKDRILNDKSIGVATAPSNSIPLEHIRFKGGVMLPSVQQIQKEQAKLRAVTRNTAPARDRQVKNENSIPRSVPAPAPEVEIISKPQCEQSEIAVATIPEDYLAEGQSLDLLFFNGEPPFDVKTTIGKFTTVVPFNDAKSAEFAAPFASLDISCLPFRLRSTGKKVFYGLGAMALKNYDADQDAEGTFDPTIRKYIEQSGLAGISQ